ncbi:hypothetical protein, partial [Cryptosporangium minutisporangium]
KEFLIPENVEKGLSIFGDVKVKELIKALAPSALLSVGIFYMPSVSILVKAGLIVCLIGVPLYLVYDRPVRKNIPVMYNVKAGLIYALKQKRFSYKKERFDNDKTNL